MSRTKHRQILIKYLPTDYERKIVYQRGSAYICLPKEWVEMIRENYGNFDTVDLLVRDTVIVVRPVLRRD